MPNDSQKEEARKKTFYHNQRVHAEETGDQGTVDKIYKKLGKNAPQVGGSDRVDKAAMGLPMLAVNPGAPLEGAAAGLLSHIGGAVLRRMFPEAADQIMAHLGMGGAEKALASGGKEVPEALGGGSQRALASGERRALPKPKVDEAPAPKAPRAPRRTGTPKKPATRKAAAKVRGGKVTRKLAPPKKVASDKPKKSRVKKA